MANLLSLHVKIRVIQKNAFALLDWASRVLTITFPFSNHVDSCCTLIPMATCSVLRMELIGGHLLHDDDEDQ